MAKNNDELLNAAGDDMDVYSAITSDPGTFSGINTQDTKGTKNAKPGYYRFNLNMPLEYNNYLKMAAYNASTPGHVVTITAYINELIRQDMEKAQAKAEKEKEGADNAKE